MVSLSSRDFEALVEEALASLPARFANLLENVAIVVEDEPTDDDIDAVEDAGQELLGIFRGVPLTERSWDAAPILPAQVAIFRGPILRVSRNPREVVREVRQTVIHELGHYFGLSDEGMVY
jgi:predicted Zn-dependent protease with MMP-like domain